MFEHDGYLRSDAVGDVLLAKGKRSRRVRHERFGDGEHGLEVSFDHDLIKFSFVCCSIAGQR